MSSIVAAVRNLQAAHDYYKDLYDDSRAVIKQLTEGIKPGEIEYIHPMDFSDMLNDAPLSDVYVSSHDSGELKNIFELLNGKKFKQSTLMPQKSKRLGV